MAFSGFLNRHGIMFDIERNGKVINNVRGLPNSDDGKEYVGFMPGTDVQVGDWLINPSGDRFYVEKRKTEYILSNPSYVAAYTVLESDYKKESSQQQQQTIINVGEAHHSILGSQQNATINVCSAEDLAKLIDQHDSCDKELLKEMLSMLNDAISNKEPVKKGFLSKFAGVLQRNEWITAPVATFFLEYFLSQ